MQLHELERLLSSIPPHPAPRVELEQYATPGDLAARLLAEAWALGDIEGKRVVDLGAGTGVLAIGAALLGAREVEGVDMDAPALALAVREAARLGARVAWTQADVAAWRGSADTVVMNPPFGAQKRGADRAFLDAAMRAAPVVYTMHNAATRAFVEEHAARAGFRATHAWRMVFALRQQYRHHARAVEEIEVVALRLSKERESA